MQTGRVADTSGRRRVLQALATFSLVVALVTALLVRDRMADAEPPRFCAGVGLIGGPVAATPEEALRRWLERTPTSRRRAAWERTSYEVRPASGRRSASFESDESDQFTRITMGTGGLDADGDRLGNDDWQAEGACVRSPN